MKPLIVLTAIVAVMGGVLAYGHFVQVTDSDKEKLGGACAKWISEDYADGRDTRVSDAWRRKGSYVFEVLADQESGSSKNVLLCVVDKEKGTMMKPGLASYQEWAK
ncbi:hypothetical protein [Salipiger sp. PrR007]|uniref:hypothetical protein n=1 Tax=Salipiger sp. PrR007 TaxID=2706884 RepID=UPI0013BB7FAC|nr:hypothetical protein [Salipiger sp. PrR007]NDW30968.1 hypothetical protein [Salipiger sp. PrR007]